QKFLRLLEHTVYSYLDWQGGIVDRFMANFCIVYLRISLEISEAMPRVARIGHVCTFTAIAQQNCVDGFLYNHMNVMFVVQTNFEKKTNGKQCSAIWKAY